LPPGASEIVAATSTYDSIYSFGAHGKADDGRSPLANPLAADGQLYGTTAFGGTTNAACPSGCGVVFSVTTSGKEQILHRFKSGSDGAVPAAALIEVGGVLYGTTSTGGTGTGCTGGCGTVFKLDTNGKSESVLYSFGGGTDGAVPAAGLIAVDGSLYGTTEFGGARSRRCSSGCGTLFSVSTGGTERVLYRFPGGADGDRPLAPLLEFDGALYGTTAYGGTATGFCETGCGTIFRISTSGGLTHIYSFKYAPSSSDGAFPEAGLAALSGNLYGTTLGGGKFGEGSVFVVNPSSKAERVLHDFDCCATIKDGSYPLAALTPASGALYGTTRSGGSGNAGTAFVVTTAGSENILHDFTGKPDGAGPEASMILAGGTLYGTTSAGGLQSEGTVFSVTP
jgi:uncharacterized repeat protein (TIGR03803 family)